MDSNSAKKLVKSTFGGKFDEYKFKNFIKELFNDSSSIHENSKNIINFTGKGFSDYINSIFEIGDYNFNKNESIGFYVVELKRYSSIDRARAMQRNLIAKNLKNTNKTAGLVAFREENTEDWRFSFVKLEYTFTEDYETKEKLTPAKRHSYLVGPNEPNYTCQSQFKELLTIEKNISLKKIENCFSIENVTDEFFEEYEKLFNDLNKSLEDLLSTDEKIKEEFSNKNIKVEDFTKKLLGQLVFIYFLQKKGWLGVKKDEKFGSGPRNFLRKLYDKEFIEYSNFFNDILEPLFYKGFSEAVDDYHYSKFQCKVPFLNGGLFEAINGYNWKNTDINLKNEIFKNILDTFDLFNFTVMEDQPLDKEVAVDPEMLGKVLEKLSNDRKNEGKYYTPREIVHYMCQQSLISYLSNNTDISKVDLRKFIENGDVAIESIIARQEEAKIYNGKSFTKLELADSIIDNSKELEILLREVKVVDPAVGSGAFPVGMMNEIVKAISILQLINDDLIDYYKLKKEIIENSLYGVDKDFSATDITKLRFWLSLVVDEDNIDYINALPNLDNQILCGNSLIDTFEGVELFNTLKEGFQKSLNFYRESQQKFKLLEKKKNQFFNTDIVTKKKTLRVDIDNLKWEIITEYLKESGNSSKIEKIDKYRNVVDKPFLLWNLEFSEVFSGKNQGFDIVIGNPPYVKEPTNRAAFDGLRDSPYYQGKMDLWYFFGCVGLDICKNNGVVSFIAPNNWITNSGASKFRNKVDSEGHIDTFLNFGNYKVFDAGIQTMIYIMRKNDEENEFELDYSQLLYDDIDINDLVEFLYSNQKTEQFNKFKSLFNRKLFKNNYFIFLEKSISQVINKIKENNVTYLTKNEIFTGADVHQDFLNKRNAKKINMEKEVGAGIFVLSDDEKNKLNLNKKELSLIKPYYTTEELFRYYADIKNDYWLIYTKSDINKKISNYPNIKKHLDKFKEVITSDNKPYGLHRARKEEIFLGEKIIVARKCQKPAFTYVDFDAYVSQTFNIIKTDKFDLKVLTAILNSKLIQFWLKYMGKMQGNNYQLDQEPLLKIPLINKLSMDIEKEITLNIDLIIDSKENINSYEDKINNLVYESYDLNHKEIKIIEGNI
ncbi:Eco57I restriction-modification methylase domain-containing protein [Methanobrevibacter curvatus]|uniref:site-specific DNA-methyltransferase (adenine-specific) n=1 Tax=Methanobrevibacter curvatus TaxID=49547 RepID=A0A165ZSN1_9EURY|nr:TaqI-like C-terminal specificity domain-containing protein [Methanobrevibacter curvatus]KZX11109.1 Eco57I restriction-modification methylase [Methanobrevibacter curvatus]